MSLMSSSSQMVLSSIASHLIYPDRITSSAFPRVRKVAAVCDITFDPWQSDLGMLMLSKRGDGQYACGISGVVLSIPRQTGKTFTVGTVIVLSCILETGLKVLWTAHRTRTSDETFRSMTKLVESKKIKKYVKTVRKANGQQEIEFMNGSRILFGAREQGFGRGFDGVDIEVYDEAQILTDKALDDMLPATSVAQNPLILYMGTPPRPSDPGKYLRRNGMPLLRVLTVMGFTWSSARTGIVISMTVRSGVKRILPTRTVRVRIVFYGCAGK